MSEFNEFTTSDSEVWEDLATLSRRIIKLEQRMLERLLALEAEVKALRGQTKPQQSGDLPLYETGTFPQYERRVDWREEGTAQGTIDVITQR